MPWGSRTGFCPRSQRASGGCWRRGGRSTRPRVSDAREPFTPPWPDFAIATGRLTTPYIRRLKQLAGLSTYTIILLNPKVSAKRRDLFWVPEHDTLRGPNVITTLTRPHSFTQRRLAELRATMPLRSRGCPRRAWP